MTSDPRQIKSARARRRAAACVAVVALAACDPDVYKPPQPGPPARVTIEPSPAFVPIDTTIILTATVSDSVGRPIPGAEVVWASRDPAIASVDSTGSVRGVAFGAVAITATIDGKVGTAVANVVLRWAAISAGGTYTCGITVTGVAYCWGANAAGQLGVNAQDFDPHSKPLPVAATTGFRAISTGAPVAAHTCALDPQGAAWCWGGNTSGELGSIDTSLALVPRQVTTPLAFSAITVGDRHTCGLTPQGHAYCWGDASTGALGADSTSDSLRIKPVSGTLVFSALSAGANFTCGLTFGSAAYCWGANAAGQLGTGAAGANVKTPVRAAAGLVLGSISAGHAPFTCAALDPAGASCWGVNNNGQLGLGFVSAQATSQALIAGNTPLVTVAAGAAHACGLTLDGQAWCWGAAGLLGNGSDAGSATPVRVSQPAPFTAISAGTNHTCGLTGGGVAWCWGRNDVGQLGNGSTSASATTPVKVADNPG